MYILGYPLLALTQILDSLLFLLMLLVLAAAVLSWVNADPSNPLVRIIRQLTNPLFMRARRYVPIISGLDLTPVAILLGITFVKNGILPAIATFAQSMIG
ncbi:MAG: YggT family protein [Alphaproteobacteria bacterium]